jgi:hypothetical protein
MSYARFAAWVLESNTPPTPTPAPVPISSLSSVALGGEISIDGRSWIKLKNQNVSSKSFALIMMKNTIPWGKSFHNSDSVSNYINSTLRTDATEWYRLNNMPSIKAAACAAAGLNTETSTPSNNIPQTFVDEVYFPLSKTELDPKTTSAINGDGGEFWLRTMVGDTKAVARYYTTYRDKALRNGTSYGRFAVWVWQK